MLQCFAQNIGRKTMPCYYSGVCVTAYYYLFYFVVRWALFAVRRSCYGFGFFRSELEHG